MKRDVKTLMKQIRQSSVFKQEIPMEAISGWPALQRKGKDVFMTLPYYKIDTQETKGKTVIKAPIAIITVNCSNGRIVEFCDTSYKGYVENGDAAIGEFPHKQISKLTVKEYKALKEETFSMYDVLLDSLINGTIIDQYLEKEFSEHLKLLIEPSLRTFYLKVTPKFFEYFLNTKL